MHAKVQHAPAHAPFSVHQEGRKYTSKSRIVKMLSSTRIPQQVG